MKIDLFDESELEQLRSLPLYMGIVMTGTRGSPKLVIDGFSFKLEKRINGKIYWRCSARDKRCKARVVTGKGMKITNDEHKHKRDFDRNDLTEMDYFSQLIHA